MNIPRLLYQLQEIDLASDAVREKVSRIEAELVSDPLVPERAAIARRQEELKVQQHELRENNARMDDLTDRIKTYEEKLYGGRVTNPKELSTLQKDVELLQTRRAPFEDKALGLMDTTEAAEKEIADAGIALQRHTEALEKHRNELRMELKTLASQLSGLDARRALLLPEIPSEVQVQYQALRKQKGKAVAKMEQGVCRGCGIAVTPAWLHRARAGELVRCVSCNRILYME